MLSGLMFIGVCVGALISRYRMSEEDRRNRMFPDSNGTYYDSRFQRRMVSTNDRVHGGFDINGDKCLTSLEKHNYGEVIRNFDKEKRDKLAQKYRNKNSKYYTTVETNFMKKAVCPQGVIKKRDKKYYEDIYTKEVYFEKYFTFDKEQAIKMILNFNKEGELERNNNLSDLFIYYSSLKSERGKGYDCELKPDIKELFEKIYYKAWSYTFYVIAGGPRVGEIERLSDSFLRGRSKKRKELISEGKGDEYIKIDWNFINRFIEAYNKDVRELKRKGYSLDHIYRLGKIG